MADAGKGIDEIPARQSFFCSPGLQGKFLVFVCAVAVSIPLFVKSRPVGDVSPPAAFSVPPSSLINVKISGDVRHPGVYQMSAKKMTIDAIKMAGFVTPELRRLVEGIPPSTLVNGMSLNLTVAPTGMPVLTASRMSVEECLVLEIPLDLNQMSAVELDKVPGIGPALADRIVLYRHNNGGFMRVTDLLAVGGIGEKSFSRLKKYFK